MTQAQMRIRVVSDGSSAGTRVFAVGDDGTLLPIEGVERVTWGVGAGGKARAILVMRDVQAAVEGEIVPLRVGS